MKEIPINAETSEKLNAMGVSLIYVFGSGAEGCAHDLSDLDVGVVLENPRRLQGDSFSLYNQLYDLLTDIVPHTEIDIVFLQDAGLEVCADTIRHGQLLFASSPDAQYAFEEQTMILYADFKPLLEGFNKAVLERI
jgi:predicted nucleotidyltransferase